MTNDAKATGANYVISGGTFGSQPPQRMANLSETLERRFGRFGEKERREFRTELDDVADSGSGSARFTVRGHAAVFDQWSLDLGGFREKIAKGAFDSALAESPDVFLFWDHDPRYALARTSAKSLELRTDPRGLHYWARVSNTSFAQDLRVLMEDRIIDQASFAFTVAKDEWRIIGEGEDEKIERTIMDIGELFDVTITATGAYPQTDSQIVGAERILGERALAYAQSTGRLNEVATVAQDDPVGESVAPESVGGEESTTLEDEVELDPAPERSELLSEMARAVEQEKERKREFARRKYSL